MRATGWRSCPSTAPGDELGVAAGPFGASGGEEEDGFEDVGLALGVVAEQDMEARREIDVEPAVVAEVAEAQMGQMHSG